MRQFSLIPFIFLVLYMINVFSGVGCANIIPPSGGPRDSIPPKLIESNPPDSTTGFKNKEITFTFDEFVDVKNISQNLVVSPTPAITPVVDFKLKTVTVRLKDTLESNTTYTLNFGEAIADINEGNPLKNFTYLFSTGSSIDSLIFQGKVLLAETGQVDSTLVVMLHKNLDDSAVIKERPRYVTKLNSKGIFVFRNLPSGTFTLFALKDDGGTRRYQNPTQLFAFADKPVMIPDTSAPVTLYAYQEKQRPVIIQTQPGKLPLTEKRLRFTTNLSNNQLDLLEDLILTFDKPLRFFDSSKIVFSSDSNFVAVTDYKWAEDTSRSKIQLSHHWKENTVYHLILDKEFAEDTLGRRLLRTDTITFNTRKQTDYGNVRINFRNIDITKHPVLLVLQSGALVRSFKLNAPEFYQQFFLPGDYELRILFDENDNGKWDPGEFLGKHKQPELVKPIERRITVKPDWENEFEITL